MHAKRAACAAPPCHTGVLVVAAAQKDRDPDPASASAAVISVTEDGTAVPHTASVVTTVAAQTEENQNPDDAAASAAVMMGRAGAASARSSC